MDGAREVKIPIWKAWVFYILAVAILHNSKLVAGNPQHSERKLADNPSGFITLDCGLPENNSYEEKTSGISYISDAIFVDTGLSRSISPEIKNAEERTCSSSGLTGEISADISNLVMLQILDLSNNNLNGSVLYSLSQLPHLRVLNLERNQLTGSIPLQLIERSNDGSLLLSVGDNPNLCGAAAAAASAYTKSNIQDVSLESIQRQFTYSELPRITNNFSRILGKGGFGTVYHGYIDDTQVKLLMRVHHRNLTTLVGYCYEGTNMGLIYEYMAKGDLEAHLSDDEKANILTWEQRLRIATDAAQGLEYLHHGCKPPIVHRDVKCTNILLNETFQAKLADFGLSKIFPTDSGTHVTTVVAGTPGYVDPEYYISNRLTEKADVYSFGVVLLKIITGRPAMGRSHDMTDHISRWVGSMIAKGDIRNIVDPRMPGNLDVNSAWKAVEIAMLCASPTSARRPNMSQVLVELKEYLATEMDTVEMVHLDLISDVIPLAR
ncbi:hypothetical protein CJ030_MR3G026350 [Morella rubra]|uniref:Protein kinase domain-containing protein n=1 Tax=Morella rubra TaxID=262757 RepID=A0A6A1W6R7_9ROSI|nr:hypothetical protein CJ030_MR3G026350 [Morella rubra]